MENFAEARHNMVESQVRPSSVTDSRIMRAMASLPREKFVPAQWRQIAYMDEAIPLTDAGSPAPRFLIEPMVFARLAQLAGLESSDLVLDVGCGGGYSTAVLASVAESVVALESEPNLVEQAEQALAELEIANAAVVAGELVLGVEKEGPFDVIVLNGAVEAIPASLTAQLSEGGRMVAIVREGERSSAWLYEKLNGEIKGRPDFDAHAALLPGFAKTPEFVF